MSAKVVILDLETYPTRDPQIAAHVRDKAIGRVPAGNTAKGLVAVWNTPKAREERASEAWADTALDPVFAEIICTGVLVDEGPAEVLTAMWPEETEQAMLQQLADKLQPVADSETVWVGFNHESFDLRILLNRFARHSVQPPAAFPQFHHGKWWGRVYDVMHHVPSDNGRGMVGLGKVALGQGLSNPKEAVRLPDGRAMSGALVREAFDLREWNVIADYCLQDLSTTRTLYDRYTASGNWGTWEVDDALDEAIGKIWQLTEFGREKQLELILDVLVQTGKIPRRYTAGVGGRS